MPDSLMFNNDAYVVLETNLPEEILTPIEMAQKLTVVLEQQGEDLPLELIRFATTAERVQYLLDTSCELNLRPGEYLQWYQIRLEKP
jgi:hypothetical protein